MIVHHAKIGRVGDYQSIGVFLMATYSYEDLHLPAGIRPTARTAIMTSQQNQSLPLDIVSTA